jgi:hypothetical protein
MSIRVFILRKYVSNTENISFEEFIVRILQLSFQEYGKSQEFEKFLEDLKVKQITAAEYLHTLKTYYSRVQNIEMSAPYLRSAIRITQIWQSKQSNNSLLNYNKLICLKFTPLPMA